jgi:hypothetical protein
MACLIRWMDWSPAGVFGSQPSLVSGILSSAHHSGFAVWGGACITSEESRHELMAIIPVGLVAVDDVG